MVMMTFEFSVTNWVMWFLFCFILLKTFLCHLSTQPGWMLKHLNNYKYNTKYQSFGGMMETAFFQVTTCLASDSGGNWSLPFHLPSWKSTISEIVGTVWNVITPLSQAQIGKCPRHQSKEWHNSSFQSMLWYFLGARLSWLGLPWQPEIPLKSCYFGSVFPRNGISGVISDF